MKPRTRIAPSPTGPPHIGTAYIALFNLAFARRHGGTFILRMEDTDRLRSTATAETQIIEALRWLGINWDEGPDIGGAYGPYRQSEARELYLEHVSALWRENHVYPCFCTPQRLRELRAAQINAGKPFQGYDRACAGMADAEARRRIDAGETHVFRLRMPLSGDCRFRDLLRGEIVVPWADVDDQILLKADGYPTYHLANVVDDHRMKITHVIRGEEWISSTPKHLRLYQALGRTAPEFAHLPLLRNPDRSKLSKRRNPTGILYYRAAGFLPPALLNFLGLISHSFADGREEFSLEEFCEHFSLERISLGGPVFDVRKLREFNARKLRSLTPEELFAQFKRWRINTDTWMEILRMAQPRLQQLTDLVPMASFLFADRLPDVSPALLRLAAGGDVAPALERFHLIRQQLERTVCWNAENLRAVFEHAAAAENLKLKKLLPWFFVCICGSEVSLPLFDSMLLLGRDLCLRRIQYALEDLSAAGYRLNKKQIKALQERDKQA